MRICQSIAIAVVATALSACATGDMSNRPTSNPVAGAAATSAAGSRAIGAYGAIGTSDDVRGRSSGSGASVLTGRANMAGSDAGTSGSNTDSGDTSTDKSAKPPR